MASLSRDPGLRFHKAHLELGKGGANRGVANIWSGGQDGDLTNIAVIYSERKFLPQPNMSRTHARLVFASTAEFY